MKKTMLVAVAAIICGFTAAQADPINLNQAQPSVITKTLTVDEMNAAANALFVFPSGLTPASVRYVSVVRNPDGTGRLVVSLNPPGTQAPQARPAVVTPPRPKK